MRASRITLPLLLIVGVITFGATHGYSAITPGGPIEAKQLWTARALSDSIDSVGPRISAERLNENGGWFQMRRAVRAGWQSWISLLPAIMPYASGSNAEQLRAAMRYAMRHDTESIIRVLDQHNGANFGASSVCRAHDVPRQQRWTIIRSLEAIHDIHLQERAQDCLSAIKAS